MHIDRNTYTLQIKLKYLIKDQKKQFLFLTDVYVVKTILQKLMFSTKKKLYFYDPFKYLQ